MDAIICTGCQKQYNWNAKYAGKKVRCKCGQSMLMPADDELGELDKLDQPGAPHTGAYDVVMDSPESAAPRRRAQAMATAPKRVASDRALEDPDADVKHALSEKYVPLGVLVAGVLIQLVALLYAIDSISGAVIGWVILLLVEAILFSPLAVVSMFIAARISSISFGPLMVGIYKMTAITIGGGGLADLLLIVILDMGDFRTRTTMGMAVLINLFFVGIPAAICFKLETDETFTLVITMVVARFILLYFLLSLFF